nr:MAG TPA: hypothetical protein [Bacteriophage sp.]
MFNTYKQIRYENGKEIHAAQICALGYRMFADMHHPRIATYAAL